MVAKSGSTIIFHHVPHLALSVEQINKYFANEVGFKNFIFADPGKLRLGKLNLARDVLFPVKPISSG